MGDSVSSEPVEQGNVDVSRVRCLSVDGRSLDGRRLDQSGDRWNKIFLTQE